MAQLPIRKWLYFAMVGLRGQALGTYYERYLQEDRNGISPDAAKELLIQLLTHCKEHVPYYSNWIRKLGDSYKKEPFEYLQRFPILTKETIRSCFEELKSSDLSRRKWYYNTSGGSTGEPARFIQDWDYAARSGAFKLLYSKWIGKEIGEKEVRVWGAIRDIAGGTEGWQARLVNWVLNTSFLSVFRMTPDSMREYISILNTQKPRLIVGYAGAMFELAKFAEREALVVAPQRAIITSAATLYPFMREKIEKIFQCRVFDRYGSREVGDIACERPECEGLWVAPWGNYVEIVDGENNQVPDGSQGEILVTSLINYAMPLIRYRIGDRAMLSPERWHNGQVLQRVLGRSYDTFLNSKDVLIDAGYFMPLLYFRDWIVKYQVVQKSKSNIVFKIVRSGPDVPKSELEEITAKTHLIMADDCDVNFEFLDEIPVPNSGKFRYIIRDFQT